jgi:effector-binding domain-containing protein
MLKIGEFSKLSHASVKALRHYDELGLLVPARIDRFTGYRYYALDQLPRLNRILALKDLGFSLDEVARLLDEGLPVAQIQGMLRLKQAELDRHVRAERERLARVAARLRQIEQEGTMPAYEVVTKQIGPQLVASARDTLSTYPEVGRLIQEVYAHLHQFDVGGSCAAIWHDMEHKESDIDGEGAVFIDARVPGTDRIKVYELPGGLVASVVHHGSFNDFPPAYAAVLGWIEANGYQIVGPNREVYLRPSDRQDDASAITEIQFPVARA